MWRYGRKLLIVRNHPVRFGSHSYCGSVDKMFLIYHLTPSKNMFGLSFLMVSHHFIKFSCHRLCGSSNTAAKTLQDNVIKESDDFMEGNFYPPEVESYRNCVNGYITILICQVILQDHVIICSYDFMGRSHSR